MTDPSPPLMSEQALSLARRSMGPAVRVVEIAGDASARRFYRLSAGDRSAILMEHPDALDRFSPFYSNLRILQAIGAPVPRLLDRDDGAGLVLVEDLGETTLQRHLLDQKRRGTNGDLQRSLYRQACDLIVLFHLRGMAASEEGDFARRNALDRERLLFELRHFHRHFIAGLGAGPPAAGEEAVLQRFYQDLADECGRQPKVYCHRDFQSRNLMVRGGGLALIDFQDARRGPYTYDIASLLRDSSLDLEEELVEEMLGYLAARLALSPEELRADFDRMALQRNLKDLGTFAYMATERERRDYLQYVPRTVRSVRRALLRDRRYDVLYDVLDRLVLGVRV